MKSVTKLEIYIIRKQLLLAAMAIAVAVSTPLTVSASVVKDETPKAVEYIVQEGDYLEKLALEHGTTWNRLWNKNGFITNPDLIFPGDKVMIPSPDEVLPERALPTPAAQPAPLAQALAPQSSTSEAFSAPLRASGGPNGYSYGYCTWYVKNLRPDIGGYWGDGYEWLGSAQAAGYATGNEPRAGAIGVAKSYNHVVYVDSVNGDGSVNILEMNYVNWNVASSRTASASEFVYIY